MRGVGAKKQLIAKVHLWLVYKIHNALHRTLFAVDEQKCPCSHWPLHYETHAASDDPASVSRTSKQRRTRVVCGCFYHVIRVTVAVVDAVIADLQHVCEERAVKHNMRGEGDSR